MLASGRNVPSDNTLMIPLEINSATGFSAQCPFKSEKEFIIFCVSSISEA